MTRNRRSARQAGARFEKQVADYLAAQLHDDRIERRARTGAKDRGDITGLRHMGQRLVVECKDTSRWTPGEWLAEAEVERGNDDAVAGLVVAKRRGKGDPGDAVVLMTLRDLAALLTGTRDPWRTPDDPILEAAYWTCQVAGDHCATGAARVVDGTAACNACAPEVAA